MSACESQTRFRIRSSSFNTALCFFVSWWLFFFPSFFGVRETQYGKNFFLNWLRSRDPKMNEPLQNWKQTSNLKKTHKKKKTSNWMKNSLLNVSGEIKKVKNVDLWIYRIQTSHGFFKKKTDFSWEVNKSWQRSKKPGPHEWHSKKTPSSAGFLNGQTEGLDTSISWTYHGKNAWMLYRDFYQFTYL